MVESFGVKKRSSYNSKDFYQRRIYNNGCRLGTSDSLVNENVNCNVIHLGDSRNMKQIRPSSVHLMVTSPPYNVGKEYDDNLTIEEYKSLLKSVFQDTYRVLVNGGRACINVANVGRKPYIPIHAIIIDVMAEIGYLMRGEIIWQKGASAGVSCAWGSWRSASNPVLRDTHEYILVFCKNSFDRKSKSESSIESNQFVEFTKSVWNFSSESAKRVKHPAPFPVELPRRLIELYSFLGDVILDPFMGSGTTAEAAVICNRRYIGYDNNEKYVNIAKSRLARLSLPLLGLS